MSYNPSNDDLIRLLDAAGESAVRLRQVLIVLSTASIIGFISVWNSLEFSWMRTRANVWSAAEIWSSYQEEPKERQRWDVLKAHVESGQATDREKKRMKEWKENYDNGEVYAKRILLPHAQIKETAKKYRDAVIDSAATVRIAAFGIVIDANDTAILGGISLLIILAWLRYSLWRHCSNLSMAFWQADAANRLEFAYRYISTKQVLIVPTPTPDGDRPLRPPHAAPPVLFCLPFIVVLIALLNDLWTFEVVAQPGGALIHAVIQSVIAVGLLYKMYDYTSQCHQLGATSKKIWMEYFERLNTSHSKGGRHAAGEQAEGAEARGG